jgi:phospholipid transport system substrate-binding protein
MRVAKELGWALCLCLLAGVALGQQQGVEAGTAHELVRNTTREVMAVVKEAQAYAETDPERYYAKVQDILDPVIDFRWFARGVMGPYASSERYRSLDESGRARLRDQLDRFTEVMRVGLVRTYSKGLLAYGGSRIEVPKPEGEAAEGSVVTVRQLIYSDEVEPYVLLYQMGRDKSGQWKLRNVIIESVNLGEIYRNQFEAAAREYNGDLDAVIANWTTVEVET